MLDAAHTDTAERPAAETGGDGTVRDPDGGAYAGRHPDDIADIARLEALVAAQGAALAHSRKIFERASAVARIGVWECSLPDEILTWTNGVYDLFDLPRGSSIDRASTLQMYTASSARTLQHVRMKAIAERTGFQFDAEIVTASGRRRWMRLTASVEVDNDVAVRLFGMKQDITEEKILADRTRYLAEFDVMTGLANRSVFQARLDAFDAGATGTLLLVDLDGFKRINDTFGHAFGDDCLTQAAGRLHALCPDADLVARIGGDEFAVILAPQMDEAACARLAADIVAALKQPVTHRGETLTVGASIGFARADGSGASELFTRADTALYAAKAEGRNTYRSFVSPPNPTALGARVDALLAGGGDDLGRAVGAPGIDAA